MVLHRVCSSSGSGPEFVHVAVAHEDLVGKIGAGVLFGFLDAAGKVGVGCGEAVEFYGDFEGE